MSDPTTCADTRNAISSPASADGRLPPGSLDGPTTANCGQVRRRASRSASRAKEKPWLTIGTCGPTFFESSVPEGPLSSWESRLRRRLARAGSTECSLTWKASATPAGRPLSRLVPSTGRTVVIESGSSPMECWPTPMASEARLGYQRRRGSTRGSQESLTTVVVNTAAPLDDPRIAGLWSTPTSVHADAGNSCGLVAIRSHALAAAHGATPNGSSATMEKPGALNPAFVCWLMGFPPEWDACAPSAMPSSRKSRRK